MTATISYLEKAKKRYSIIVRVLFSCFPLLGITVLVVDKRKVIARLDMLLQLGIIVMREN
jgi:hypothetical protein